MVRGCALAATAIACAASELNPGIVRLYRGLVRMRRRLQLLGPPVSEFPGSAPDVGH